MWITTYFPPIAIVLTPCTTSDADAGEDLANINGIAFTRRGGYTNNLDWRFYVYDSTILQKKYYKRRKETVLNCYPL